MGRYVFVLAAFERSVVYVKGLEGVWGSLPFTFRGFGLDNVLYDI
jgi:hypothetical protein